MFCFMKKKEGKKNNFSHKKSKPPFLKYVAKSKFVPLTQIYVDQFS